MTRGSSRGVWLPLLLFTVLTIALRLPTPAAAWRPGDDLDLDLDLDHDHDLDLDEDDDDLLGKDGVKRIRLPKRMGGDGDWGTDFDKMLHAESPWLPDGKDGRESYEEFVKRFSSEAPHEEQELDDWD